MLSFDLQLGGETEFPRFQEEDSLYIISIMSSSSLHKSLQRMSEKQEIKKTKKTNVIARKRVMKEHSDPQNPSPYNFPYSVS